MNHLSIGMTAPDFTALTTFGMLRMSDLKGKWVVFFSHPGDFTPVCTTEFIAFTKEIEQFNQLGVQLIGLSIDSNPSHLAWANSIRELTGLCLPFPIVADRVGDIAKLYGMIAPEVTTTETVRNVYIIDPEQKIRCILIYPLTTGRYIPEIIRIIEALQTADCENVVTPANWQPGDPVLVPPPKKSSEVRKRQTDPGSLGLDCYEWYLCFKKKD
ncbi:MAG: peroxiredoxin [bacterium]|nr:peroxiredoxin [bacterium]